MFNKCMTKYNNLFSKLTVFKTKLSYHIRFIAVTSCMSFNQIDKNKTKIEKQFLMKHY